MDDRQGVGKLFADAASRLTPARDGASAKPMGYYGYKLTLPTSKAFSASRQYRTAL